MVPVLETEENIAHMSAGLLERREDLHFAKVQKTQEEIDDISNVLYFITDLKKELRQVRSGKKDGHVNISSLESKIDRFREVCDKFYERHPDIPKPADMPFPEGMRLDKVEVKSLEWIDSDLANMETRYQGDIQKLITTFEAETLTFKQLVEILTQVVKMHRDHLGYLVRQQRT